MSIERRPFMPNASMPFAPVSADRLKIYVDCIINNTPDNIPEPVCRIETFLAKIAGADIETPTPYARAELYLAKIYGDSVELPPRPISRMDYYLAKLAGGNVEPPEPETEIDFSLQKWLENAEKENKA